MDAIYASRASLLAELRSTGVGLEIDCSEAENRGKALLAHFQVRPILIDRILEAQLNDEET